MVNHRPSNRPFRFFFVYLIHMAIKAGPISPNPCPGGRRTAVAADAMAIVYNTAAIHSPGPRISNRIPSPSRHETSPWPSQRRADSSSSQRGIRQTATYEKRNACRASSEYFRRASKRVESSNKRPTTSLEAQPIAP